MRRNILVGLISVVFLLFLFAYHSIVFSDKDLRVIFCNIGQGDGIVIRTAGGSDIIVDGGPDGGKMIECLSRHLPIWDRDIEVMYLTHPDADHLAVLIDFIKSYNVKYFGTSQAPKSTGVYKEFMSTLQEHTIPVHWVFRGDQIKTKDGISMITFWPTEEFLNQKSTKTNDYSLVQEITYGKFTALLDGDILATYLNSIMPLLGHLVYLNLLIIVQRLG